MRARDEVGSGTITENQETHGQVCSWHGAEVQPSTLRVGHEDLKILLSQEAKNKYR